MTTFTIPEVVIGVPLWVPNSHDFFTVETGMPNGDSCLAVHGNVNNTYKAIIKAPTLAKDIFNVSNHTMGLDWSMSCWLKLKNLSVSASTDVMLGCSTYATTTFSEGGRDIQTPLLMGPSFTSGFKVFREPLNNISSPDNQKAVLAENVTGWDAFQDYWHLFVFNIATTGTPGSVLVTGTVWLDTYANAFASDTAGNANTSGVFGAPRYLHIGAYGNGMVGRGDEWRIGKWAFHDHLLSQSERLSMYQTMMGAVFVYADDFNRASIGTNWVTMTGYVAFDILSNQARATSTTNRGMMFVRDLSSPNMYARVDVVNHGWHCLPTVRNVQGGSSEHYAGGYSVSNGQWEIQRSGAVIASAASPDPTPPYTTIFEAQTNAGNVELRVLEVVAGIPTLRLSFTDTSASKILTATNAGLLLRGQAGTDQLADNWSAGML